MLGSGWRGSSPPALALRQRFALFSPGPGSARLKAASAFLNYECFSQLHQAVRILSDFFVGSPNLGRVPDIFLPFPAIALP